MLLIQKNKIEKKQEIFGAGRILFVVSCHHGTAAALY